MAEIVISCEGLGKRYEIGERERYKALRDIITDAMSSPFRWARSRFERSRTDCSAGSTEGIFWALKDLSFKIKKGEVVGVIGRNGAGKSTLLKILSRITAPTTGEVRINGRIGSLLEVGTGFHPELTGRENIFLNGTILGMKKREIERKFDEIVAFAEIDKFLDTPVKRYSSGMYVRLAFAVAAHLQPEILIVDEVLAVGDAQFQKKCLGKMQDVGREGRTVLFVSHTMGSVLQLCESCIWLENGYVRRFGAAPEVVREYMESAGTGVTISSQSFQGPLSSAVRFTRILVNGSGNGEPVVSPSSEVRIKALGECTTGLPDYRTTMALFKDGIRLVSFQDCMEYQPLQAGSFSAEFVVPSHFLRPGTYSIAIGGRRGKVDEWVWGTDVQFFTVLEEWGIGYEAVNLGLVNMPGYGTRGIRDRS